MANNVISGFPNVFSRDFLLAVQMGQVPGFRTRNKFGRIDGVTSSLTTVNCNTPGIIPKVSAAQKFYLSSDSALDTLGGAGAEAIYIEGVDADFNLQSEIVNLSGLTLVETEKLYLGFITRLQVVPPEGSEYDLFTVREAEGQVTCWNNAGGTIPVIRICPLNGTHSGNQSLLSADIVPSGETAFIHQGIYNTSEGKSAVVTFRVQEPGGIMHSIVLSDLFESPLIHRLAAPLIVPEKSIIEVQALSSSAGVDISARWETLYVKNEYLT